MCDTYSMIDQFYEDLDDINTNVDQRPNIFTTGLNKAKS